jgi:hypothetical protein
MALATILAAAALGLIAAAAMAPKATTNTTKFCTAVKKIGNESSPPTTNQAKTLVKQFNSAAINAPPNIKSAIRKITKYLNVIAGDDLSALKNLAKSRTYQGYASAIGTYTTYVAANCN